MAAILKFNYAVTIPAHSLLPSLPSIVDSRGGTLRALPGVGPCRHCHLDSVAKPIRWTPDGGHSGPDSSALLSLPPSPRSCRYIRAPAHRRQRGLITFPLGQTSMPWRATPLMSPPSKTDEFFAPFAPLAHAPTFPQCNAQQQNPPPPDRPLPSFTLLPCIHVPTESRCAPNSRLSGVHAFPVTP